MPTARLIAPTAHLAPSYVEALREGFVRGTMPPMPAARIAAIARDFESYLAELQDQGGVILLPGGGASPKVPFSIHWLVEGDSFIGELSLRHRLSDSLRLSGGHVGYGVRPTRQGRGYGRLMLRLALDEAKRLGIDPVLVTAHEDNIPSRRVIEANGGRLQDIIDDIFGGGPLCRYWITLDSGAAPAGPG
jgi:predicted acetyltransferase